MNKARKMAVMLLMVFGAVSVSFGVDLFGEEEHYEKLKAELEMYDLVDFEKRCYTRDLDYIKNVVAFFDEIKAREEVKVESCKKRYWARNCFAIDKFNIAVEEVKEMPRFKNDTGIRNYRWNSNNWWESVWNKWDFTKIELESCGAKKAYWEAVAKESE